MNDLNIRPFLLSDIPAVSQLILEAGWEDHDAEEISMMLETGHGLVAVEKSQLIGTSIYWNFGAAEKFSSIDLMIVDEAHRKRGVGSQLMKNIAKHTHSNTVLWSLDAHDFYQTHGFAKTGVTLEEWYGAYEGHSFKQLPVQVMRNKDRPSAYALDTASFGASRKDILDALLARPDARAGVLKHGNQVIGFAASRTCGDRRIVGPLIAADDEQAASLIGSVLEPGESVQLDVPVVQNTPMRMEWLKETGLSIRYSREIEQMARGQAPNMRSDYCGLLSQSCG